MLVGAIGIGGCSLVTDLTGFQGSTSAVDAGGPIESGVPPIDGAALPDATDAAQPASDAGCALRADAAFCVDFEGNGGLDLGTWSTADFASSLGTIALTQAHASSPPNAARFDLNKPVTDCEFLQLKRGFNGTYQRMSTAMQVRIETPGIFFGVVFDASPSLNFRVLLAFAAPTVAYYLIQRSLDNVFSEVDSGEIYLDIPVFDTFIPVRVDVDIAKKEVTIGLRTQETKRPLPADVGGQSPDFQFGPYCTQAPTPGRLSIDDVAVWLVP